MRFNLEYENGHGPLFGVALGLIIWSLILGFVWWLRPLSRLW
jgi:hypothetical protein